MLAASSVSLWAALHIFLAGRTVPTAGAVDVGPTVVVGYYDQHGTELDPAARVQEEQNRGWKPRPHMP